jgi:3-methyladenine DNA glycosylase/8-oxoguanine DNA glycosylase
VHSAGEFYGCSQARERELFDLQSKLDDYYNRMNNDQSLSVGLIMTGDIFVTLHNDIYQRVVIK